MISVLILYVLLAGYCQEFSPGLSMYVRPQISPLQMSAAAQLQWPGNLLGVAYLEIACCQTMGVCNTFHGAQCRCH